MLPRKQNVWKREVDGSCLAKGAPGPYYRTKAVNHAIMNLNDTYAPVYSVQAHKEVINCIDGVAGRSEGCGAPELVTGGKDGSVKVWDPRQKDRPVALIETAEGEKKRECWAVSFGNSYNAEERMVVAGYDNGDLKMFDLKTMSLKWETNLKNGVCGVDFDRRDIPMNKLVATTLEAKLFVFDLKTLHREKGFAYLSEKAHKATTVWAAKHLPQNRDLFVTCGGSGSLNLWQYNYPTQRTKPDIDDIPMGVPGSLTLLQETTLSSQPINSLDWSADKLGLAVCTSFDQTFKLLITTKLNLY
ncbi:hypothetical protein M8J77_002439 [Diaphorina citri]|nr:hypothetical protein M8J77_002439 [Diaphorina citri]